MSLTEKSVRWIRKHPAVCGSALVVAAAIVVVMVVLAKSNQSLAIERDLAVKARREADEQQALAQSRLTRAIESIDKTMSRVSSKRWSMDPSLQDERRVMLENVIQFYSGLIEDASDTEQVRFQAVKAYDQVAGAKFLLNDLPGAIEACRRSLELSEKLVEQYPERHEYLARKAGTLSLSGSITAFHGDMNNGLKQMYEAVGLCTKVADDHPEIGPYQITALDSMSHYAYFVISGESSSREAGRKLAPEILRRAEALEAREDISPTGQVAIAFGINVVGAYELSESRVNEAKKLFERSRAIARAIENLDTLDARHADGYYHVWAIACINLCICCMNENPPKIEQGLEMADEGLQPLETLIQVHPSSFVYKMQKMQALRAKAGGLSMLGKNDAAEKTVEELKQLTERIVRENPTSPWVIALRTPEQSVDLVKRIREGDLKDFEAQADQLLEQTQGSPNFRPNVAYNILCAYAQATRFAQSDADQARYDERIKQLIDELMQAGYFDNEAVFQHVQNDEDLAPLKDKIDWSTFRKKSS